MDSILVFVVGLAIGSFLNVCIYRIPRKVSILVPSSHCPACKKPIRFQENIPVLSFLILKGRCRYCGASIHWRYPLVEFLGGSLLLLSYLKFGLSFDLFLYYAFSCAMIIVTFVDLEHRIIPDRLSLPFILIGLGGSLFSGRGVVWSLLGVVVGGGSLALVAYVYLKATGIEGMGGGDVKLAAMIGAFLGWKGALMVIFLASLGGAALGLALILIFRVSRRTPIPFGSFMAPASVFVLFYSKSLVDWYWATVRIGY